MTKNYQRKYKYPKEFVTKRGTLKKNHKKQINNWLQKVKHQTPETYNNLMLENYFLQKQVKEYSDALEDWVIIAQNNMKF